MRHARFTFFICALVIAIAFWPPSAHAVGSTAGGLLSNLFAINVLDLVERVLDLVRDILVTMVNFLGGILQQALALPLNTGGPAVYAVWKLLRDMCNLLFIVAFIAMAFGTIFNVVWKNDYYYSSAIKGVLIAAIGINFSLAIGQTVIWGGNAASKEIIALMPKGIALQIAADLRLADRTSGASTPDIGAIPGADTPNELLSDNERIAVEAWGREGYTRALTVFRDCLKRNESPHACFLKTSLSSSLKEDIVAAASKPTSQEIGESFWDSFLSGSYGKRLFANAATKELQGGVSGSVLAIQQKLTEILSYIVLLISYLALVVFMFVRVVAMWLLLSVSALAVFSLAIPGKSAFKGWFYGVVAWSIFSPLYLFIIYLGLYLLSQRSTLLASLQDAGGNISFVQGFIADTLYLFIAGAIFIGGAGWALKTSFELGKGAGSLSVGTWFGATAGKWFGISEKTPYATRVPGAAALGRITGITPAYQAGRERVQQFGADVVAGARGRLPSLLKTEEEALALRRSQFGVRGGDKAYEAAIAKRVGNQKTILESQNLNVDQLRGLLSSENRDAALAAGEILLAKGALSTQERDKLLRRYGDISPLAKKEFQKRITEQLQKNSSREWAKYTDTEDDTGTFDFDKFLETAKQSGKSEDIRKFLEAAMRGEVGSKAKLDAAQLQQLADAMDNNEDKRAFFDVASKSGRNKVAAIETMANMGLLVRRDGTRLTADEALSDRAGSFSADDWLDAEEYADSHGGMSGGLRVAYDSYIQKPSNLQRMSRDASSATQRGRLIERAVDLAQDEAVKIEKKNLEKELQRVQIEAEKVDAQLGKYQQSIARAKQKVAAEGRIYKNNPGKQNRDKLARAAAEYRSALDDLNHYRKKITGRP